MEVNALTNNLVSKLDKTKSSSETGFSDVLADTIKKTVSAQEQAKELTAAVAAGEDVPMHKVIQAVGQAETTLQTMLSVRDKALEAYQEVIRMPI